MYGYQYYNQPSYNQAPQDDRIWVQSKQAAEAYLVAPGGFVRLWDTNGNVYYEKRADASGRPLPLDVYEYSRKTSVSLPTDYSKELKDLTDRVKRLEESYGHDADDTSIQSV